MTTDGVVTGRLLASGVPLDITAGPDGNLWLAVSYSLSVNSGFLPTDPRIVGSFAKFGSDLSFLGEYRLPSGRGAPTRITSGPDGNLWFTEGATVTSPRFGRITPAGAITEVLLSADVAPTDVTAGPDGAVWMTEVAGLPGGRIARVSGLSAICTPSATALCLDSGRFTVEATWTKSDGTTGPANAVPLGSSASAGYLWFFSPDTPEVTVKMIEGCSFNGNAWFFAGGLTNVRVDVKVTDMMVPGGAASKTYTNPLGTAFTPVQDTVAFPCPASSALIR
jgi:hypothetical protein